MPGVMGHTFSPSTGNVEAGRSLSRWDQSGLYSELQISQNYIVRRYIKQNKTKTKMKTKQIS